MKHLLALCTLLEVLCAQAAATGTAKPNVVYLMAALKMPETRPLDGKNIWPALRDNTASPVESYYWPFKGNDSKSITLNFKRGEGIDQFGREQASAPAIQAGPGAWEHRVIGLSSSAPGALPRHGLVFKGGKPGTYKLYLDNLRLRHADGSTTPIWTKAKDTRFRKIHDTDLFTGVQVRAVQLSAVNVK